jgi:UPF0755 protein
MAFYHSGYRQRRIKKHSKQTRVLLYFLFVTIILAVFAGYLLHNIILKPNTWVKEGNEVSVYIRTGSTYDHLKSLLYEKGIIINRKNFEWLAKKKNLENNIHPGRYLIRSGMSNNDLINLLRSGKQTPVQVIFNNIRTKQEFAGKIEGQIEADSISIITLLNDPEYLKLFGLTMENVLTIFIPNTYEVYWNTGARDFMERMYSEHKKFWNEERMNKAAGLGLDPIQVCILASIVEKETAMNDEKPDIAGVYLNRLKKSWPLQADPTVVYAWGDFNIRRVLNVHKEIDSPYNTYLYNGLPPGPICIPSISSIEAVIHAEKHDYMFFCARADFSGYHVFASTHNQHVSNANKYRQALDARNIKTDCW